MTAIFDMTPPKFDTECCTVGEGTTRAANPNIKLLAIDGLNVLRRCYEANPAPDSPAKAQGALKSALSSFRNALTEHAPTHAVAAFDFGGKTWRHELYAEYRKSRKPMPEPLREVVPLFRQAIKEKLGLVSVAVEGVEADDTLAAITLRWTQSKSAPVVLLSTDKDMCALVGSGVQVRDHFNGIWRDEAWILQKFGVPSSLLADLLALMGDTADDIPGVPGVGAKTAAKLLNLHGGLEAVLAAAPSMKGAVAKALVAHADLARLSRQLVAMRTDVAVGLCWRDMRWTMPA